MCTIPPPPPPPSLPELNASVKLVQAKESAEISPTFSEDLCQWAAKYPELREACIKYRICLNEAPYEFQYKHFQSVQQVGPTCGLVALSMILNNVILPSDILKIALEEGFTNNGEMFSCKNMLVLAEKVCGSQDVSISVQKGELFSEELIKKLLDGAVLMVPYDADLNHAPCLKQGHKAHWAIVCGVIVIRDPEGAYTLDSNNVYVLCKHGKSKYVVAWKLDELCQSNSNLWEFAPRRENDGLVYVLPEGGIAGPNGLRDQFVIFVGL